MVAEITGSLCYTLVRLRITARGQAHFFENAMDASAWLDVTEVELLLVVVCPVEDRIS